MLCLLSKTNDILALNHITSKIKDSTVHGFGTKINNRANLYRAGDIVRFVISGIVYVLETPLP